MQKIFLLGGRTGGPLIPLLAIADALPDYQPYLIGVRSGFESHISTSQQIPISYLPEAKLRILSFQNHTIREKIQYTGEGLWHFSILLYAVLRSMYLLLHHKPVAIFSAGSFLAVPVVIAAICLRTLRLLSTKIVIHQQDPEVGITHKIIARFGDMVTVVFAESKKTPGLQTAKIIPNPYSFQRFSPTNIEYLIKKTRVENPELHAFLTSTSSKPLFLIFGGGSGSEFINEWVFANLTKITKKFRVLHLTGVYLDSLPIQNNKALYFQQSVLTEEMPLALTKADVVLSRSGLGSITEYLFLQKKAYIVPIPQSHQEANARAVSQYFYSLSQEESSFWLEEILTTYPRYHKEKAVYNTQQANKKLSQYYAHLRDSLKS